MNKLVIDTREQDPLSFRSTENYTITSEKLDFGDYGLIINDELKYVFERKNPGDLFGTLTSGHNRFKEEVERAKQANIPFIIIVEESYHNVINKKFPGSYNIKMQGYILAKIMHTMMIRHNLVFMFFNNKEESRDFIRNTFTSVIKETLINKI